MAQKSGFPVDSAKRATSMQQAGSDSAAPAKRISIISYQRSTTEGSKDLRRKGSKKRRKKRKMANVLKENPEVKTSIKSGWDKKPVNPVIEEQPNQDVEISLQAEGSSPTSSKKSDSPWNSEQQPNSEDIVQTPKGSGSLKGISLLKRRSYSVKIEDELLERGSNRPLNIGPETEEDRLAREQWEKEEADRKAAEMQALEEAERKAAEMQALKEAERKAAEMQALKEAEQTNEGRTSTPVSEEDNKEVKQEMEATESKHTAQSKNENALILIEDNEIEDLKQEGEHQETKSEELKIQETSTRPTGNTSEKHLQVASPSGRELLTGDEKIILPEIITIRARNISTVNVESNEELEKDLLRLQAEKRSDANVLVRRLVPVLAVVLSGAMLLYYILISYG